MKTLLLLALLCLSGCATWYRPGGDNTQFQRDRYECMKDSAPVSDQWRQIAMEAKCLEYKGWTR